MMHYGEILLYKPTFQKILDVVVTSLAIYEYVIYVLNWVMSSISYLNIHVLIKLAENTCQLFWFKPHRPSGLKG